MSPDQHRQLELEISRELKALPELTAPDFLTARIRSAIKNRLNVPWYRRSWETWPVALRAASFVTMLALFGGLCLAGWEFSKTEAIQMVAHRAGMWLSGFNTFGSILDILAGSAVLVMKKLGVVFILAVLVAAGLSYTAFLSLGTVYFRTAFLKRQPSQL